jgi:condensin complex subunit 2
MEVDKENAPHNRAPAGAGAKASLNKVELQQMLGQCLKLASENKITSQNTWSLPLIENMPELIKAEDEEGQTNFQRASVTLDAGVKIYSHRVDSVHTETFKVLGSFGRASGPAGGEDNAGVVMQGKNSGAGVVSRGGVLGLCW